MSCALVLITFHLLYQELRGMCPYLMCLSKLVTAHGHQSTAHLNNLLAINNVTLEQDGSCWAGMKKMQILIENYFQMHFTVYTE